MNQIMHVARPFRYLALGAAFLAVVWAASRSLRPADHPPADVPPAPPAGAADASHADDDLVDPITRRRHDDSAAGRLVAAAAVGDSHRVKLMLGTGLNPNMSDVHGYGPLQQAAAADAVDTVRILLEAGAEIDKPDKLGWSSLSWAAYMGAMNSAAALLEAGADPNHEAEPNFVRPLDQLMGAWHMAQEGADRMPPLLASRRFEIARQLLTAGADPNQFRGVAPFEAALFTGDADLVALFLEHGATLDALWNPRLRQYFLGQPGAIGDLLRGGAEAPEPGSSSSPLSDGTNSDDMTPTPLPSFGDSFRNS